MIEVRNENPIFLKSTNAIGELAIGEKGELISSCGAVFSEDHYGFYYTDLTGNTNFYPTQCTIFGVEVENGILKVLEDGKCIPWRIDVKTGKVIESAKFLNISRRDIKYLEDHFGLGIEDMESVNSYFEDQKRLKKQL